MFSVGDVSFKIIAKDFYSGNFSKLDKAMKKAFLAGRQGRQLARDMAGFGVKAVAGAGAVGFGFAKFVQPAVQFERTLGTIQSKFLGVTKNDPKLQALAETIKFIGGSTEATSVQVGQAAEKLAMAGMSLDEIKEALPGIVNLKLVAGDMIDIVSTADIASNIATAFFGDDAANQMTRMSDVMAAVTSATNTDVVMLGESMKEAGAVAKTYGLSFEESAAVVGLLGNVGVQGTSAGTGLKNMAIAISTGGDEFKKLGIDIENADGKLKSMSELVPELAQKLATMSDAEAMETMNDIFGKIGIKSAAPLSAVAGKIGSLTEKLENSAGTAEAMAKVMGDNLTGDLKILGSNFDALRVIVGDLFLSDLREATQSISKFIIKISDWMKNNSELTKTLFKVGGIITAVIAGIGAAALVLAPIIYTISAIAPILKIVGLVIAGIGAPIVAAVAALAALGAIIFFWDDIKDTGFGKFLISWGEFLKPVGEGVMWLWGVLQDFYNWVMDKLEPVFTIVKDFNILMNGEQSFLRATSGIDTSGRGNTDEFGIPIEERLAQSNAPKGKAVEVTVNVNGQNDLVTVDTSGDVDKENRKPNTGKTSAGTK